MKIVETTDVKEVRPLYEQWVGEASGNEFGLRVDTDVAESRMQQMIDNSETVLLVAFDSGGRTVGCYTQTVCPSAYSDQLVAVGTNWFSKTGSGAGPKLLRTAKRWAKQHGCGHVLVTASNFASSQHDKICRYCERIGGKKFETIYVMEVS